MQLHVRRLQETRTPAASVLCRAISLSQLGKTSEDLCSNNNAVREMLCTHHIPPSRLLRNSVLILRSFSSLARLTGQA
jgi:hypothetical protein